MAWPMDACLQLLLHCDDDLPFNTDTGHAISIRGLAEVMQEITGCGRYQVRYFQARRYA